jgi:hypothetical protein
MNHNIATEATKTGSTGLFPDAAIAKPAPIIPQITLIKNNSNVLCSCILFLAPRVVGGLEEEKRPNTKLGSSCPINYFLW